MLAADHRWQWEEFCDARSLPRERIREVKRLAGDGFLLARERSAAVRESGALLIDEQYSSAVIADGLARGISVGTPAEKAGAIPLAWATDPFSAALTGAFVKVLARYRPDDEPEIAGGAMDEARSAAGLVPRPPASRSCSKCWSRAKARVRGRVRAVRPARRCSPTSSPRPTGAG